MQGLINRIRLRADDLDVRPAAQSDRVTIDRLIQTSRRVHFNLDSWAFDEWLYPDHPSDALWLAWHRDRTVGLLLAPNDRSSAVWLRALAVADGYEAEPIFVVMLDHAQALLHTLDVNQLVGLAHPDWMADLLSATGFAHLTEVITFRKSDRVIPSPLGQYAPVTIRPALPVDIPIITANDRAAFDPVWWHSERSIAHMLKTTAHFIVAEADGQTVGHAFSDIYDGHGHLIRLAVRPDFQQRGIGEQLLIESLQYQRAAGAFPFTVNTQIDNLASQALYRRFGYQIIGSPTQIMSRAIDR